MKLIGKLVAWMGAGLLLVSNQAMAQGEPYQEGVHYFKIDQAIPERDYVEVAEAFSYLCNHCATFEPYIQSWKAKIPENVKFRRIHVGFGQRLPELYSRAFITASQMGIEEQSHQAMMDAVHKERKQIRSIDGMAEFYAQFGVDPQVFKATAGSFGVSTQLSREQKEIRTYGITGTPNMVVNGRYRITSSRAVPGFDAMLAVVDYLVGKELAALQLAQAVDSDAQLAAN